MLSLHVFPALSYLGALLSSLDEAHGLSVRARCLPFGEKGAELAHGAHLLPHGKGVSGETRGAPDDKTLELACRILCYMGDLGAS